MTQTTIITTNAVRERYAQVLAEQRRYVNAAADEYRQLHWWQWRRRRKLERVLWGLGGWRVRMDPMDPSEPYIPRRKAKS